MSTGAPRHRTLWEEGRCAGALVAGAAAAALLVVVALDLLAFHRLEVAFDVCFVLVCLGAALAVRPRDFFVVGVLPPLALLGTVLVLAAADRAAVADQHDVALQAVVSGLAHHAGALVAGYGVTLVVLALRQVALRHSGRLRGRVTPGRARTVATPVPTRVPEQRSHPTGAGGEAARQEISAAGPGEAREAARR